MQAGRHINRYTDAHKNNSWNKDSQTKSTSVPLIDYITYFVTYSLISLLISFQKVTEKATNLKYHIIQFHWILGLG